MRSEYIKKEALWRIISLMSGFPAVIMRVSLETGMRVGDVCALKGENIDGRYITYTAQKTGKNDKKKVSAALAKELAFYKGRKSEHLFASSKSKSGHISRQTVWRAVTAAREMAEEKAHVTPHTARKTYAVEYKEKYGLAATQKALQHTNAETTALYAFADVALGGKVSAYELNRLIDDIANRCADRVVQKLQSLEKEKGEA